MSERTSAPELLQALAGVRPALKRAVQLSFVAGLVTLSPVFYMWVVYDRVLNSRSHTTLLMLTLLVVFAYVVMELVDWARSEILRGAGTVFEQGLSARLFDAVLGASLRHLPGGSVQTMQDLHTVRAFFSSPTVLSVFEMPTALAFLAIVFYISPHMALFVLLAASVQALISWLTQRATHDPLLKANNAAVAAYQHADGSLRNAEVIESMGMLPHIYQRWQRHQQRVLSLQGQASLSGGGYQALAKFWQQVVHSGLMGLAAWAILNDMLAGGPAMMMVISILGGRVLAPLVQIVTQSTPIANARAAWQRLSQLLAAVPAPEPSMSLPAPLGRLQVESLVAGAPGSSLAILRGVSFSLSPGEVMAVIGPSASGKTTLARLLVGIWPSVGGKVRLDGADVYAWRKTELGPHVGYLPQDVELFEGTIADNIARFGPADPARTEAAARLTGLHDTILSLPQGYQSPVGRDGVLLSGGQRQRVALARALYGNPVLVVLDEPNSSLDEAGDAALAHAIATLKAQGTTFVIMTHRTSVLAVTDKMLMLREGQVQAFGPRDDVLAALNQASVKPQVVPVQAPAAATPQQVQQAVNP